MPPKKPQISILQFQSSPISYSYENCFAEFLMTPSCLQECNSPSSMFNLDSTVLHLWKRTLVHKAFMCIIIFFSHEKQFCFLDFQPSPQFPTLMKTPVSQKCGVNPKYVLPWKCLTLTKKLLQLWKRTLVPSILMFIKIYCVTKNNSPF